VQIYEEKVRDPQGQLTTSFLGLDTKVKDNRIQPKGSSSTGPNADILAPVGTEADPNYQQGCGCSVVRYQLQLTGRWPPRRKCRLLCITRVFLLAICASAPRDANGPGHREADQVHQRFGRKQIHRDFQLETENRRFRAGQYTVNGIGTLRKSKTHFTLARLAARGVSGCG